MDSFSDREVKIDWEGFRACIERRGTPERVHVIELFLDGEISDAVCERFGLQRGLDPDDPFFAEKRHIRVQRFLGYDYVRAGPEGTAMPYHQIVTADTAQLARAGGRAFTDEHTGPITSWEEFEKYPWPDPEKITARSLEWYQEHLPDDMCVIGGLVSHYAEYLSWLMGYETLCYALFEKRDLVQAIVDRLDGLYDTVMERLLAVDRVKFIWGSDAEPLRVQLGKR